MLAQGAYSLCEPGGLFIAFTVYLEKGSELGGKGQRQKLLST